MSREKFDELRKQAEYIGMTDVEIETKLHRLEEASCEALAYALRRRGFDVRLKWSWGG